MRNPQTKSEPSVTLIPNSFFGSQLLSVVKLFVQMSYFCRFFQENIHSDDVATCLEIIGKQLKGLKIQCSGFDLADVAANCPRLVCI